MSKVQAKVAAKGNSDYNYSFIFITGSPGARSQVGRFSQPDHVVLQYLLLKNVSGPAQFKLVLFKGQLWCGYALAAALFPKCTVGQRPVS